MFSSGSLGFQDMFWYLEISWENLQNFDIFELFFLGGVSEHGSGGYKKFWKIKKTLVNQEISMSTCCLKKISSKNIKYSPKYLWINIWFFFLQKKNQLVTTQGTGVLKDRLYRIPLTLYYHEYWMSNASL